MSPVAYWSVELRTITIFESGDGGSLDPGAEPGDAAKSREMQPNPVGQQ